MPEVILKNNTEAQAHFLKELGNKWEGCDQWMGVLFRVKDGKIELCVRTTYSFPVNDCLAAIGLLASNLHQEVLVASAPLAERPPALPKYMKPLIQEGVEEKPMSNDDAAEIIKHGMPLQNDAPVERYKDAPCRKTLDQPDSPYIQDIDPIPGVTIKKEPKQEEMDNFPCSQESTVDKEQQGSILPYPRPEKDEL